MIEKTPATILIVDDEPHNRKLLDTLLRHEGYLAISAATGEEALLSVAQHAPDLILLDVMMPGMNGYEVARRLKANPATSNTPIIMVTALIDRHARMTALDAGVEEFLTKPVDRIELGLRVRNLLRLKEYSDFLQNHNRVLEQQVVARTAELQKFRQAMDAAADGIYLINRRTMRCDYVNATACALLGYTREELLQLCPSKLHEQMSCEQLECIFDAVINGQGSHETIKTQLLRKNGSTLPAELQRQCLRSGEDWLIVEVVRDITERNRLEQKTLEQAQKLVDLDRRKDEFLAMLSHELRNPMAALSGAVHLLRMQKNEAPLQQQGRSIIERQVGHLKHLVDDLLEVSRITMGSMRLRQQQTSLTSVVERALETANPYIVQRRHALEVLLPPEPIFLHADAVRLEQVLVNLLTNAAKYTDEGGCIWLSIEREGLHAVLRVRDTGIGITPELLPRIFELFTQAERSLDRSQGGLGIGLCLVQRLVELHHGSVEANSVVGQGSEFIVRLPMMVMAHPMPLPVTSSALVPSTGRRVLVVDDNKDAAQSLATLLEMTGHEVQLAYDGFSALQIAMDYLPQVVLLDIGLPGLNGYAVAQRIRQQDALKNIVLVALTGYGLASDRQRSLDAGFNHHLAKPADFDEIVNILATCVPDQAAQQPAKLA